MGVPQSQAGGTSVLGGEYPSPRQGYPSPDRTELGTPARTGVPPPPGTGYAWTGYVAGGSLLWFPTGRFFCNCNVIDFDGCQNVSGESKLSAVQPGYERKRSTNQSPCRTQCKLRFLFLKIIT